jgi:methionyl aminopeptidase
VQAASGSAHVGFFGDGDERLELDERHACERSNRLGRGDAKPVLDARESPGHRRGVAIELHGSEGIAGMRRAGSVAAATLREIGSRLIAGITTAQIDAWVREDTARRGARPSQLGVRHGDGPPFSGAVCVSRNQVVCHGVPSVHERLSEGDIVNLDVTSEIGGFHGDTSATFTIGLVDAERLELIDRTRAALEAGIASVRPGARIGDIGAAIEAVAEAAGMSVVREFCGHGIGRHMHMAPQVAHVGKRGTGLRLRPGMTFTIEPMLTLHPIGLRVLDDGWTVVTEDGSPSAQFEHTLLVTDEGYEVLTLADSTPS